MTWWTIKTLHVGPSAFTAGIGCTTSAPDHLFMKYAPWEPIRHLLWRMFRGKSHLCGYKYVWDTPLLAEQALYGDTIHHVFALKNLTPSTDYWGYIFAPDGPYGQEIQGPLMHWKTIADPIPPEITVDPIPIDVAQPVFRCGNRYTFWANGTWYAHIPDPFSLSIWKLIAGTFVRQDHAHEPVAPVGVISDADSRMDSYHTAIHCSYFCLAPFPGPNHLRYATFDLLTDHWLTDELVWHPMRKAFVKGDTCIALDSWQRPHIIFTDYANGFPVLFYTRNQPTGWRTPMIAMNIPGKINEFPSFAISPNNNTQWLTAVMNTSQMYLAWHFYRATAWDPPMQIQTGLNLPHHSAAAPTDAVDIAQVQLDWRVDSWRLNGIVWHAENVTPPVSLYANVISTPAFQVGPLIAFRDDDNHLAYVRLSWPYNWDPPVQLAPDTLILLTANFATPDVVSCLYTKALPVRCAFFSFYAPWH